MADSWESSKSRKPQFGLVVIALLLLLAIGFLTFNNLDIFQQGKGENAEMSDQGEFEAQKADTSAGGTIKEPSFPLQEIADDAEVTGEEGSKKTQKIQLVDTAGSLLSVLLPTVTCMLADVKTSPVQVSLKVYFTDRSLEREILFKRDAIVYMVKKIVTSKRLDEIVVEDLRAELQKEVNTLLEQGTIVDIEFLDFQPVLKK